MKFAGKIGKIGGVLSLGVFLVGSVGAQSAAPTAQSSTTAGQPCSSGSPMIYPAKGQSPEQMERDKADAYAWAKQQSGYDPMSAGLQTQPSGTTQPAAPQPSVPYTQPAPPPPSGGVVRGGARGAAGGAAIGAIAGNAGKGAAIGAASGGAIGGIRQGRAAEAQQQAVAQQQAAQQQALMNQQAAHQQQMAQQQAANQQKIDAFKRAYTAALEGKGYTVKW